MQKKSKGRPKFSAEKKKKIRSVRMTDVQWERLHLRGTKWFDHALEISERVFERYDVRVEKMGHTTVLAMIPILLRGDELQTIPPALRLKEGKFDLVRLSISAAKAAGIAKNQKGWAVVVPYLHNRETIAAACNTGEIGEWLTDVREVAGGKESACDLMINPTPGAASEDAVRFIPVLVHREFCAELEELEDTAIELLQNIVDASLEAAGVKEVEIEVGALMLLSEAIKYSDFLIKESAERVANEIAQSN